MSAAATAGPGVVASARSRSATICAGALLGTTWAVVARVWMRYVSEDPEFTWNGTLFILIGPTLIGLAMGVVRSRAQPRASRVLGGVSPVLIGVAAGIIMLPTVVLGAVVIARTSTRWWWRAVIGVVALLPVAVVVAETDHLGFVRRAAALLWYLLLCWWLAAMVAVSYRTPTPDGR